MSHLSRKKEIVWGMHAKDKVVQGIEDRLINLGHYQQYALEQTFGEEMAPRKTFDDLVSFYRALNHTFNLGLLNEVFDLRLSCDLFEEETRHALSNVDDRYLIRSRIENYFRKGVFAMAADDTLKQSTVLFDVRIEKDGQSRDYDTILLTSGGVVILETRTPDRNVSIDEEGNYITFYYQEARIEKYNLRERMKADKALLSDVLREHGAKNVPIIPVVVFSGKLAYSNLCDEIKTIRDRQLGNYLDEMCSKKILDAAELGGIHNILQECRVEIPKPRISCYTSFIEAYAELRSKVEAKILGGDIDAPEECDENEIAEKHPIADEKALLWTASREDVRDFLMDHGIDEEMAFQMSERVRKGKVHCRGWTVEMTKAMDDASIPDWFREGCKKILFLSKRTHYCEPTIVDSESSDDEDE